MERFRNSYLTLREAKQISVMSGTPNITEAVAIDSSGVFAPLTHSRSATRQAAFDHYRKQRRQHPTSQLSQHLG